MMLIAVYVIGCLATMLVTATIACAKRKSHEMSSATTALLTLSAAVAWPLLFIAVVQGAALYGLKQGLNGAKSLSGRRAQSAQVEAPATIGLAAAA